MDDWRKSTYSDGNGGACVEVADGPDTVLVRDTTDRGGITLSIAAAVWQRFAGSLK
jgi:hypothetical protein